MPPKKRHAMFVSNLCNPQLDPENIFSPHIYNREVESYFVMLFFRDHLTSHVRVANGFSLSAKYSMVSQDLQTAVLYVTKCMFCLN